MNFTVFNPGNTKPFTTRKSTNSILLHHAAALICTPEDIIRWHKARGFNGAGYNFFVRKNGVIYQLRPIWAVGAHTIGWNSVSIGICAEGNFELEQMPEIQAKAIAECIKYCNNYYGTTLNLYLHKQKWQTACPGRNYPLNEIEALCKVVNGKKIAEVVPGRTYLMKGDKGEKVGELQSRLKVLKYYAGKIDNDFGTLTDRAVRKFQEDNKLVVDGKAGAKTMTILAKAHVDKCPTSGIVTATKLNVRSGPSTRYKDIGDLAKGETVKIAKQSGKWFSIYFGNHGGWVSAEYIKY